MATGKRCSASRSHKPHLWSRTTRKTVTEETPGDTFQCPGATSVVPRPEVDARGAQIAADARSGRNWASEATKSSTGPGCICGAGDRTQTAAIALKGVHGNPTGECQRHPGGTVWASLPEVWERIRKVPREEEDPE